VHRVGDPAALRAKLDVIDAMVPVGEGKYAEALVGVEQTIAKLEAQHQTRAASQLYRIHSALLAGLGRIDEARTAYAHEVEMLREMLGEHHPEYADALVARGGFRFTQEDYAGASVDLTAGYKAISAALGPDDMLTVLAGAELSRIDLLFGRHDAAIAKRQRAVDAAETRGETQTNSAAHRDLALAFAAAKRFDDAEREVARSSAIDDKLGPQYKLADDMFLAQLRFEQGRLADSRAILDRIRPELIKLLGADNPALSDIWILDARFALAAARYGDAEAALAKVTSGPAVTEAKVILTHVLAKRGDRKGAAAARKEALARLDAIGPGSLPELRAELDAAKTSPSP
jgi:tetratricopeptide (TPR) repeat protein